jgi:hypothetical protein
MSERRRAIVAAGAAGVVLVLVFLLAVVPWFMGQRTYVTSTPTVRPLAHLTAVWVAGGEAACLRGGVLFEPAGEAVRFQVRTRGGAAPPLEIEATAPGYHAAASRPGGYRDHDTLVVGLTPPAHAVAGGTLCLRNAGRAPVGLVATAEPRHYAPLRATVGNRTVEPQVSVAFVETSRHSVLARLGTVADRVSAFRPGIVGRWTLYALALLVSVGVPALIVLALLRSAPGGDAGHPRAPSGSRWRSGLRCKTPEGVQ